MRTRQLSDLILDVRKRADVVGSTTTYPDADITEYINQGWARIYGMLCRTGENHYRANATWTTVSGQDTYYTTAATGVPAGSNVLPTDMWLVKAVDVQVQAGRWLNATRYQEEQRNDYQASDWSWPIQPLYDYQGSGNTASLRFIPPPSAATPMRMFYYPAAARMSANTDTIDGGNGWEIYAIDWAAKECAAMDANYELIQNVLNPDMAAMEANIRAEAASRNAGVAPKIRKVRYRPRAWVWPGGGGRF